jgi:hypothetical protein
MTTSPQLRESPPTTNVQPEAFWDAGAGATWPDAHPGAPARAVAATAAASLVRIDMEGDSFRRQHLIFDAGAERPTPDPPPP